MKGLFSSEFRKDHVKENAKEKYNKEEKIKQNNMNSLIPKYKTDVNEYLKKHNKQLEEQYQNKMSENELDLYFRDIKQINSKLVLNKKLRKEEPVKNEKTITSVRSNIQSDTPIRKLRRDLNVSSNNNSNAKAADSLRSRTKSTTRLRDSSAKAPMKFK